jgi:hypothetical protein
MLDSFTFTLKGVDYVAEVHHDSDMGAPWEEHDGHGPVSDWTTRAKRPGEIVISEDSRGRSRRYYDFAAAVRIAKADGWNAPPYDVPGETKGRRAVKAVMADYARLRAWCDDEWYWVGVVVRRADSCSCCGASESCWGIESDSPEWIREVAEEMAEQLSFARKAA